MAYFFGGLIMQPLSADETKLKNTALDIIYSFAHNGYDKYTYLKCYYISFPFSFQETFNSKYQLVTYRQRLLLPKNKWSRWHRNGNQDKFHNREILEKLRTVRKRKSISWCYKVWIIALIYFLIVLFF